MPNARKKSQQLVELAPGVNVPTEFEHKESWLDPLGGRSVVLRTDPDEREPRLVEYTLYFSDPPMLSAVTDDHIVRFAKDAIINEAQRQHNRLRRADTGATYSIAESLAEGGPRKGEHVISSAEMEDIDRQTRSIMSRQRGRPPVSDELKLEVLAIFEAAKKGEGLRACKKAHAHLSDSTLRHYLTDARKIRKGAR